MDWTTTAPRSHAANEGSAWNTASGKNPASPAAMLLRRAGRAKVWAVPCGILALAASGANAQFLLPGATMDMFQFGKEYIVSPAVGDVNGDGLNDIVFANSWGTGICVMLNGPEIGEPDGYVAGPLPSIGLIAPVDVTLADVDGDGDLDAVTADWTEDGGGGVGVYFNAGDGTFEETVHYPTRGLAVSVAVDDLDGDGDLDVVAVTEGSFANVLYNDGSGTLGGQTDFYSGPAPAEVVLDDVDGDGAPDMVVASQSSGAVTVLRNTGDGSSFSYSSFNAGAAQHALALGDLDGDGDLDIVAANQDADQISVLVNTGNGTFADGVTYNAGEEVSDVDLGDLDGDGDLDIVTANARHRSHVSVLLNAGDASFAPAAELPMKDSTNGVAIADINHDGVPDAVFTSSRAIDIRFGKGDGSFFTVTPYDIDRPNGVDAADVDGDGDLDLVVASDAAPMLLINDSRGAFTPGQDGFNMPADHVAFADMDGDGDQDIVFHRVDVGDVRYVGVAINTGGAFAEPVTYPAPSAHALLIGDVNGDSSPDVVLVALGASVMLNDGRGALGAAATYDTDAGLLVGGSLGDIDNDGDLDIVASSHDTAVQNAFLINAGDGTFSQLADPSPVSGVRSRQSVLGDLDGDGNLDLVALGNTEEAAITVRYGLGDGTFEPGTPYYNTGRGGYDIGLADFNGDGLLDIVFTPFFGDHAVVHLNLGDRAFSTVPWNYRLGIPPESILVADLDGNDAPDLVATDWSEDAVVVSLGVSLEEDEGHPADIDGDGDIDVQDLLAYLTLFRTQDARADFDADSDVDVQDLLAYLTAFRQG